MQLCSITITKSFNNCIAYTLCNCRLSIIEYNCYKLSRKYMYVNVGFLLGNGNGDIVYHINVSDVFLTCTIYVVVFVVIVVGVVVVLFLHIENFIHEIPSGS